MGLSTVPLPCDSGVPPEHKSLYGKLPFLGNWGERRGTIPRQPDPQSGALPTELLSPSSRPIKYHNRLAAVKHFFLQIRIFRESPKTHRRYRRFRRFRKRAPARQTLRNLRFLPALCAISTNNRLRQKEGGTPFGRSVFFVMVPGVSVARLSRVPFSVFRSPFSGAARAAPYFAMPVWRA